MGACYTALVAQLEEHPTVNLRACIVSKNREVE